MIPQSNLFLERKFENAGIEKSQSSLLAGIKVLENHAVAGTVPSGLQVQLVRTKGQDTEAIRAKFDDIIRDVELKQLDAAIENLCIDVEAHRSAIQEREGDIDGTFAEWKSHLLKLREITSDKADGSSKRQPALQ